MSTRCYILNLPIETLDLVYKYIPDMREKLNFAKAHDALGKAFAFHAGDIFKNFSMWHEYSIQDLTDILSLCGSSLTGIQIWEVNTAVDMVQLASIYCPNLEELYFPISSSFWKHFKPLLLPLQNLVRIELWNSFEIGLSNSFEYVNLVEILQQLPKLENLKIYNFNSYDLEDVGKLVNLKELTIDNGFGSPYNLHKFASIRMPKNHAEDQLWPNIELLDFSYMNFNTSLPYLPTLKYLTIDNTRMSLTDLFGQSAFSYGKTLEELHFGPDVPRIIDADGIGIISKLKALKKLELPLKNDYCMDGISQLENLEMLTVLTSHNYITNRGVMRVINGCKKLRHLDVRECYRVDSNMVVEAVSALSLRPKEDPLNPFLLTVSNKFGSVEKSQLGEVLELEYID